MKKIIISFLILFFGTSLFGIFEQVSDARSKSLGTANTAIPVLGGAVFGNPSQLAAFDKMSAIVTGVPLLLGADGMSDSSLNMFSGSFLLPLNVLGGTLGSSATLFNVSVDGQSLFSEWQLGVAYGQNFGSAFQLGGTLVTRQWGVGADQNVTVDAPLTFDLNIGATYKVNQEVSIGLVFANVLGMNIASTDGADDSLAREVKLGFGYIKPNFLVDVDVNYELDTSIINLAFGGETYLINKMFRVGAGLELMNISEGMTPSIGFGIDKGFIKVDYTMSLPVNLSGLNHTLSATLNF